MHKHLMNTLEHKPREFIQGNGHALIDAMNGRPYIDVHCDTGTSCLGYNSPTARAVLQRMLDNDVPVHAPNLYLFRERETAARRLCGATGFDKVFFSNSGSEAVEAAIKLARRYHAKVLNNKRNSVWTYKGGFHGRTYGALAAGDGPVYHYDGFGPHLLAIHHFVDIAEIPDDAAAVCLAPVFGNNDVIPYSDGWLRDLRKHCDRNGIVLIFDEVQTGSGRTGAMLYSHIVDVKPDIVALAKGIGMGCPVGATLATEEVARGFEPGTHFSTFGGNPLSCAFVNGMLDWLGYDENGTSNDGRVFDRINYLGGVLRDDMASLPWVKSVRGVGLMFACDIDVDIKALMAKCLDRQLLVASFRPGILKMSPPLNTDGVTILHAIRILDEAAQSIKGK